MYYQVSFTKRQTEAELTKLLLNSINKQFINQIVAEIVTLASAGSAGRRGKAEIILFNETLYISYYDTRPPSGNKSCLVNNYVQYEIKLLNRYALHCNIKVIAPAKLKRKNVNTSKFVCISNSFAEPFVVQLGAYTIDNLPVERRNCYK